MKHRVTFSLSKINQQNWFDLKKEYTSITGKDCSDDELLNLALESIARQFIAMRAVESNMAKAT